MNKILALFISLSFGFFISLYSQSEIIYEHHNISPSLINKNTYTQTYNPVDGLTYEFFINRESKVIYRVDTSKRWKYYGVNDVDFIKSREGIEGKLSEVDMISADGNRLLVKEKGSSRLYFSLITEESENDESFYFINDPEPQRKLRKEDVRYLVDNFSLIRSYSEKMGFNIFSLLLKLKYRSDPFWLVKIKYPKTWYSFEYKRDNKNEEIQSLAVTYSSAHENDSLYPETSGYHLMYGGDYHWPLYNKWYNKWLRPDVEGNRHYTTFIDGAVCFYILVKSKDDCIQDNGLEKCRYKIYYCDEQSYFSGKWRVIQPEKKAPGFSAQRAAPKRKQYYENEPYLPFKPREQWWDPYSLYFSEGNMDGAVENIIFITPEEIYSINWTFWSMDFCWRTRTKPDNIKIVNGFINRDMLIIVPLNSSSGNYYQQKYLPENNTLPEPTGKKNYYSHEEEWELIRE